MKQLNEDQLVEFRDLPKGIMRPWTDGDGHSEDFEYTALRNMFRYENMRDPNDEECAELRDRARAWVQLMKYGKDINEMEVSYEEVRPQGV